jgi:predicted dehydrogenase
MDRRDFLTSAAAASGALVLPTASHASSSAHGNKLKIALIGVGGRAHAHYGWLADENVVALCDVNEDQFAAALKRFPKAKTYIDWRKCLDHKGLDAVCICTTDHTHAFVANWALNRDLHIYCEKPLAISVEEARIVRANWLKKKSKVATQVGTQRHAIPNFERVRELVRYGAIGDLKSACAWDSRKIPRAGYYPAAGSPPKGLHYDLWLGPSPFHPYNPAYFVHRPNVGCCLSWNMFWDFGAGQVGDMGSHTMDLLWNAVDARLPTSAEGKGTKFNPDVTPVDCQMHFQHPANDWRGPIKISWYQGGAMPRSPEGSIDLTKIGDGAMFEGTKGALIASFDSRILLPNGEKADLTYFKPPARDKLPPPIGQFQKQWVKACKDGGSTACDFEYHGNMIEQMLLGLVAYRVGKKLDYDGAAGRVANSPEADALLKHTYRTGWTLDG